jgi:hypothetical protein
MSHDQIDEIARAIAALTARQLATQDLLCALTAALAQQAAVDAQKLEADLWLMIDRLQTRRERPDVQDLLEKLTVALKAGAALRPSPPPAPGTPPQGR